MLGSCPQCMTHKATRKRKRPQSHRVSFVIRWIPGDLCPRVGVGGVILTKLSMSGTEVAAAG